MTGAAAPVPAVCLVSGGESFCQAGLGLVVQFADFAVQFGHDRVELGPGFQEFQTFGDQSGHGRRAALVDLAGGPVRAPRLSLPSRAVRVGSMGTAREVLLAERERVLQRIAALEREFAGIAEAASADGTDDEHDPEGATLAFERQHAAALLAAAREQLAAVDAALARDAAGNYGRCERCGQPIGADRLAARPAAALCIRCAAAAR